MIAMMPIIRKLHGSHQDDNLLKTLCRSDIISSPGQAVCHPIADAWDGFTSTHHEKADSLHNQDICYICNCRNLFQLKRNNCLGPCCL